MKSDQRGQALPFMLVVLVMSAMALMITNAVLSRANGRSRAQTAADATALAAASGDASGARMVAKANQATVKRLENEGSDVIVEVQWGDQTAKARARTSGSSPAAD